MQRPLFRLTIGNKDQVAIGRNHGIVRDAIALGVGRVVGQVHAAQVDSDRSRIVQLDPVRIFLRLVGVLQRGGVVGHDLVDAHANLVVVLRRAQRVDPAHRLAGHAVARLLVDDGQRCWRYGPLARCCPTGSRRCGFRRPQSSGRRRQRRCSTPGRSAGSGHQQLAGPIQEQTVGARQLCILVWFKDAVVVAVLVYRQAGEQSRGLRRSERPARGGEAQRDGVGAQGCVAAASLVG